MCRDNFANDYKAGKEHNPLAEIYILSKYVSRQWIANSVLFARNMREWDDENMLNIYTYIVYVSNSTGAIIRVKLIRHFRNDCGTNEVHVKPIIRLEFPAVAAKYARWVSGEITRAAGDCLRSDLPVSPTVCQGDRRRSQGVNGEGAGDSV